MEPLPVDGHRSLWESPTSPGRELPLRPPAPCLALAPLLLCGCGQGAQWLLTGSRASDEGTVFVTATAPPLDPDAALDQLLAARPAGAWTASAVIAARLDFPPTLAAGPARLLIDSWQLETVDHATETVSGTRLGAEVLFDVVRRDTGLDLRHLETRTDWDWPIDGSGDSTNMALLTVLFVAVPPSLRCVPAGPRDWVCGEPEGRLRFAGDTP